MPFNDEQYKRFIAQAQSDPYLQAERKKAMAALGGQSPVGHTSSDAPTSKMEMRLQRLRDIDDVLGEAMDHNYQRSKFPATYDQYEAQVRMGDEIDEAPLRRSYEKAQGKVNAEKWKQWAGGPVKQQNKNMKEGWRVNQPTEAQIRDLEDISPRADIQDNQAVRASRTLNQLRQQHPVGNTVVGEYSGQPTVDGYYERARIRPTGDKIVGRPINRLAGPVGQLPQGDVPQFIPENKGRIPVRTGPFEKLPIVKNIPALQYFGATPMPSNVMDTMGEANDPNLGWKEKLIRFLGRAGGLSTDNPDMI